MAKRQPTAFVNHSRLDVRILTFALMVPLGCTGAIDAEGGPGGMTAPPSAGGGTGSTAGMPPGGTGAPPVVMGTDTTPPPNTAPVVPAECKTGGPRAGAAEIRRLSRYEFDNTVADLLNDTSNPGAMFPPPTIMLGFDNSGPGSQPSALLVEAYEGAALGVATRAVTNLPALMGCMPANAAAEDTCARTFIDSFGLRAYRRPLLPEERDRYVAFYAANKTKYNFAAAVRMVVQAFLQSPYFLYRVEGVGGTGTGVVQATPYDLASRLSYLIWSSMPDKALLDAASSGGLSNAAQVANQVTRMLADPKASRGIRNFFSQWMETFSIDRVIKDPAVYARWKPELAAMMKQETETFATEVVLRGEKTLDAFLKAPYSYLNRDLATFYGVSGPTGATFTKVMHDATRRAGVLTQGLFLAAHAKPNETSPVGRGYFIRSRMLCAPPPQPPANVSPELPAPDGKLSTRERLAKHREDPSCAGCHQLMDPIGLGFERYDGIGLWRTTDAGKPVDARGEVTGAGDADGAFDGAVQLAGKLATSNQVRECFAKQYFRFAFGREEETAVDACTIAALVESLKVNNGSIPHFLMTLAQTDPFLYRTTGGAQ